MKIIKGQENEVVLTLKELTTLNTPYYLFEAISKEQNTKEYCILGEDISGYPNRFNKFVITEKTSPNALNSEIELGVGQYVYKVYEQASSTNLNPTGLNCVEEKRLIVESSVTADTQYAGSTTTYTVYEP